MRLAYYPGPAAGLMASTCLASWTRHTLVEAIHAERGCDGDGPDRCFACAGWSGAMMSLHPREEQILASIKDTIVSSDPRLAALMTTFTKLAAGEDMPLRETLPAQRRIARRPHGMRPQHGWPASTPHGARTRRGSGHQRLVLVLWFLISAALITTALAFSRGGHGTACTQPWSALCASPSPAPSSPADAPGKSP